MKIILKITLVVVALATATGLAAQRDKSYILKNTNVGKLNEMAIHFTEQYRIEHGEAIRKALEMGWDTINLVRIDRNGQPEYVKPSNHVAAGITNTTNLRNTYLVNGQNFVVGLWEADENGFHSVRQSHQDLVGRVTNFGATSPSSHATHVAGTLIGNPSSSNASRGMAPFATLKSYGLTNVYGQMAMEAGSGLLISNHSYGHNGGWEFDESVSCTIATFKRYTWLGGTSTFNSSGDDPDYGLYNQDANSFDTICHNAPYYLPVFAAGNSHNTDPETGVFCDDEVRDGTNGTYVNYDENIHPPGNSTQISTITNHGNAKNILTIGNLQDDLVINPSSDRGPTDDGRIKPDLCGNGTDLYSADSPSDNAYAFKTGTSMATPNVAGSLLLLQELYENTNGNQGKFMRSATLKALAIETATDLGNAGPDYTYGWGLLNTKKAGDLINEEAWNNNYTAKAVIIEDSITSSNQIWVYEINLPTSSSLAIKYITMAYTDWNGPTLVNDLDMKLVRVSDSATLYPWVLNPANPSAGATAGDNDKDNIEQIAFIPIAMVGGRYEIRISVEGTLHNNAPQPFSLVVEGLNPNCHANIQHKFITPETGVYTAQEGIVSQATMLPGRTVVYQSNGPIVLKPGFRAMQQPAPNTGFFKTHTGTCTN